MNYGSYPVVKSSDDNHAYDFWSVGPKGSILKRVEFQLSDTGAYALIMGDVTYNNEVDWSVNTNNGDQEQVLATVAHIISRFLNQTDGIVVFEGSTESRRRMYRMAISKNLNELSGLFDIQVLEESISCFVEFNSATNGEVFQ